MTHNDSQRNTRRAGFTLIELLVTIAIVALLVGFLLVALRGARRGAERAETLNAMRGMMTAYNAYATEHEGRLMPGYIDPAEIGAGAGQLDVYGKSLNGSDLSPSDSAGYVWRLTPYLDGEWSVLTNDYQEPGTKTLFANDITNLSGIPNYSRLAQIPSFGLNSIHLGGDSFHGPADNSPWNSGRKPFVASRLSDVLNPTKVIVFAPTQLHGTVPPSPPGSVETWGYVELRAPFVDDDGNDATPPVSQWTIDTVSGSPTEGQIIWGAGGPGGTPLARLNDDLIPISHLDGHVTTETLGRLSVDLSRWIPNALSQQ